ncbi:type VI secretion system protein TssA [Archangium primigenium]|uniref:type VI secretion system protein TssA n=1 Tax=[Archangium] primigenium TaxID=2792470 RepID=UPI001958865A|nr:type VI secretion system protein TssA [Archangium primigenium]MBM7115293.1 type VI secretion system protein TssA [Archangium primigenium]
MPTLSLEELRERARAWTEPISAETPAGRSAKHEPAYDIVSREVARLESPTGTPVDWARVVENAGGLLRRDTKDLWLAAYLAHGLHATDGLRGAVTGMTVLTEVLERYWPTLFPEATRLRGRVNAVRWFVDRMVESLPAAQVSAGNREWAESLEDAARRLAEVARTRFEEQSPPLGPLLDGVRRLQERRPAPADLPAPVKVVPATPLPPPPALTAGQAGDADAVLEQLRGLGSALVESARVLREAHDAEPLAYRLLRVGLWLHLTQAPAPGTEGRTSVPGLPASLRAQLERLETHGRWAELLVEAEGAMGQHRFSLDLQRYSDAALTGLGDTHTAAREAARWELATVLKRMPGVSGLLAADGTPFADERTRKWLDTTLTPRDTPAAPPPPRAREVLDDERYASLPLPVREVLAASGVAEAIALLQHQVTQAPAGRPRFKARLLLARLCFLSAQPALARALYEELVAESTARGLDEWEPALSVECLEGLLLVGRTVQKTTNTVSPEAWAHFRRLTRLDPSASFRLGQFTLEV